MLIRSLGYQSPIAGAVWRAFADKDMEVVSVKDFGAVGDGVADDAAALNAAFAAQGKIVFVPNGKYGINANLADPRCAGIIGEQWGEGAALNGRGSVIVCGNAVTRALHVGTNTAGSDPWPTLLRGFRIQGAGGGGAANATGLVLGQSTSALLQHSADNLLVENVVLWNFLSAGAVGFKVFDANWLTRINCMTVQNTINELWDTTGYAGTTPANCRNYACYNFGSTGTGLAVYGGDNITFDGCHFVSNAQDNIVINPNDSAKASGAAIVGLLTLNRCHFEANGSNNALRKHIKLNATGAAVASCIVRDCDIDAYTLTKFFNGNGANAYAYIDNPIPAINPLTTSAGNTDWINFDNNCQGVIANWGAAAPVLPAIQTVVNDFTGLVRREEQGEVTVTMTCGTSGTITLDGLLRKVRYSKTRDGTVHIRGYLVVDSVAAPVGSLTIEGLPFVCQNDYAAVASVAVRATGLQATAATALQGYVEKGDSKIRIERFAAGAAAACAGDIKAGSEIIIDATYNT